jgi:DNA-binding transcriptional LysR family regulator
MDAVETRELGYFVAVAEELHFGRAAARLGIAQPPLSRAIQQLERRMGVVLLQRSSRTVSLTPAGIVFLAESRKALDAVTAAVRRAQRAGHSEPRLTVVMKPDGDAGLLERIMPLYRRDPDSVAVEVVVCGVGEQAQMLRDGRVDLAFVHAPHDDLEGFDTELLLTEDHVVMLPGRHHLAGRSSLALADLDDDPVSRWPPTSPETAGDPQLRDCGQVMQLVALGQLVAVVPESVRRQARTDVVCVPLLDGPRSSVLLAWPERTRSRAVAAFVRAGTEIAAAGPVVEPVAAS